MAANYRYLLVDASSGGNLGEIPLTVSSFSYLLNGAGQLTGTVPVDHPMATTAMVYGDREITVWRDNAPVWNGPITMLEASLSSRQLTITAREASWYMTKRTLEVTKNFNADIYYILRFLIAYMQTKTGSGGASINAALPRFNVSPSTGTAGVVKQLRYYGSARHTIAEIIDDLVADPTFGLDYRMDYSAGSTRQTCQRTLTFKSPSLGVTRTHMLTEHVLSEFTKTADRERAASRVHVLGSGYTSTAQNTGSVSAGDILIEGVWDRTDKADHTFLDNFARDARYRARPAVITYGASFTPGAALPFGWCQVGDSVNVQVGTGTFLHSIGSQRVVEIDVTPPGGDAPEGVTLVLVNSLDNLGT